MRSAVAVLVIAAAAAAAAAAVAPVIGVLTSPVDDDPSVQGSSLSSHYVKWVEAAGARVVPLLYDEDPQRLAARLDALNGLFLTGGDFSIAPDTAYFRAASALWRRALDYNARGDVFPVWGTCNGFEVISILAAGTHAILTEGAFDAEGLMLPLELAQPAAARSSLLGDAPAEVLRALAANSTSNLHVCGVTPEDFARNEGISGMFAVLSENADRGGKRFISTIEGLKVPVYATQWHPERIFVWSEEENVVHSDEATVVSQWVGRKFVAAARRSAHRFATAADEHSALIGNHCARITASSEIYTFGPAAAARAQ
eukprot:m51a1_g6261 hypothetical protein (314) ;mRNA; r:125718-126863